MKILAIEASGQAAGCAVLDNGVIIGEYSTNFKKTHSQTLLPMIDALTKMTGLDLNTIDAIAITKGPGSFTGLRIGAATAKGIGLALEKPIIPIPTLDSLAYNIFGTDKLVCPIMDARRNQVYTGIYEENKEHICVMEQTAVSIDEIIEKVNSLGREVIFLGDGVPVYKDTILEKAKVDVCFAPAHMNVQRAAASAALAYALYEKEKEACMVSSDDFRPEYLRKSQAERQKEQAEREGAMDELAAGNLVKSEREKRSEHE